jgi:zinc transport system substrate-binding protein
VDEVYTACQQAAPAVEQESSSHLVTVSILPQAYFVQEIAGDLVDVNVMVGIGEEAHTYEPTPEQMKSLNDSLVFFSIGVEYETTWISRFQEINPDLKIVDSSDGIERMPFSGDHEHDDHDEEGTHQPAHDAHDDDERLDPHVWLSPANGKIIAANILAALIDIVPDQEAALRSNYEDLIARIDELDADIQTALADLEQRTFMVFHPAWGYFANAYGLKQIAVQVGGQDPSAQEIAELVEQAKVENIKVVFIQPTFNAADAEALTQELDGEVAVVDPLAQDWLNNLEAVAIAFKNTLSP